MKSGITRYTLGTYNQSAVNDVFNKAREIYVDPVSPPTTGVLPNTLDTVLVDMTTDNDRKNCTMVSSYKQYYTADNGTLASALQVTEFAKSNMWFEVNECQPAGQNISCSTGLGLTSNTAVELGFGDAWILTNKNTNKWDRVITNGPPLGVQNQTMQKDKDYDGRGCDCCPEKFNAQWDAQPYPYFETSQWGTEGDGLIYPDRCEVKKSQTTHSMVCAQYGRRYVGGCGNFAIDRTTLQGMYFCMFVRLTLIDPNGEDDRWKANQHIILSGDVKRADGSTYNTWNVGSIARQKLIPNNGDWMPVNFLIYADEIVSADRMALNPPPVQTQPV